MIRGRDEETMGDCDWGHRASRVKRLDTGGHSGVNLCPKHWRQEMKWRKMRNKDLEHSAQFDIKPFPKSRRRQ